MNAITHSTLAKPDTSCRRNRSPDTTMSSQNHNMNMNIVKASAKKLPNVNPPVKQHCCSPPVPNATISYLDQRGRDAQRAAHGRRAWSRAGPALERGRSAESLQPARGELIRRA